MFSLILYGERYSDNRARVSAKAPGARTDRVPNRR